MKIICTEHEKEEIEEFFLFNMGSCIDCSLFPNKCSAGHCIDCLDRKLEIEWEIASEQEANADVM